LNATCRKKERRDGRREGKREDREGNACMRRRVRTESMKKHV